MSLEIPGLGTLGTIFNLLISEILKRDIFEYRCPGLLNKEKQFPSQHHPINLTLTAQMWPEAGRTACIARSATAPTCTTETWLRACTGTKTGRFVFCKFRSKSAPRAGCRQS